MSAAVEFSTALDTRPDVIALVVFWRTPIQTEACVICRKMFLIRGIRIQLRSCPGLGNEADAISDR